MALFHFSRYGKNTIDQLKDAVVGIPKSQFHQSTDDYFYFSTDRPIIGSNGGYSYVGPSDQLDFQKIVKSAQNNFASIYFERNSAQKQLTLASSHFGRAKIYFIQKENDFYCSDDLRELLPFSSRKINLDAAFSIVKFGNTPEYLTIIEDVFSVPVGHYLSLDTDHLFKEDQIDYNSFKQYYKLNYSFENAQISATQGILENIMSFAAKQDLLVSISGGVDSTLINKLVNEFTTVPYPAYYLTFGDSDSELPFAKEAVKNTKADLEIIQMNAADFEPAFYFQAQNLIEPVGESSPISMAHFFKRNPYAGKVLVDGTLADGCYGSRNYSTPLYTDDRNLSFSEKRIKEIIASKLLMNDLPLQNKFHPRDSFIDDPYLMQMCHYVGSLANTLFKNASKHNEEIVQYWEKYYDLIGVSGKCKELDPWMRYSIFKMVNYAADTTNAKTYDLCGRSNQMLYPFMWKDILLDQGKYSWEEKTKNNIIKQPLKKILESYIDDSFIYRKKVGLNSSTDQWMSLAKNKKLLCSTISSKDSIAREMLGEKNLKKLVKRFSHDHPHHYISNLVISLANIEQWRIENNCSI